MPMRLRDVLLADFSTSCESAHPAGVKARSWQSLQLIMIMALVAFTLTGSNEIDTGILSFTSTASVSRKAIIGCFCVSALQVQQNESWDTSKGWASC